MKEHRKIDMTKLPKRLAAAALAVVTAFAAGAAAGPLPVGNDIGGVVFAAPAETGTSSAEELANMGKTSPIASFWDLDLHEGTDRTYYEDNKSGKIFYYKNENGEFINGTAGDYQLAVDYANNAIHFNGFEYTTPDGARPISLFNTDPDVAVHIYVEGENTIRSTVAPGSGEEVDEGAEGIYWSGAFSLMDFYGNVTIEGDGNECSLNLETTGAPVADTSAPENDWNNEARPFTINSSEAGDCYDFILKDTNLTVTCACNEANESAAMNIWGVHPWRISNNSWVKGPEDGDCRIQSAERSWYNMIPYTVGTYDYYREKQLEVEKNWDDYIAFYPGDSMLGWSYDWEAYPDGDGEWSDEAEAWARENSYAKRIPNPASYPNNIFGKCSEFDNWHQIGTYDSDGFPICEYNQNPGPKGYSRGFYQYVYRRPDGGWVTDDFEQPTSFFMYGTNEELVEQITDFGLEKAIVCICDTGTGSNPAPFVINGDIYTLAVNGNANVTLNGNVIREVLLFENTVYVDEDDEGSRLYGRDKDTHEIVTFSDSSNAKLHITGDAGFISLMSSFRGDVTIDGNIVGLAYEHDIECADWEHPEYENYIATANVDKLVDDGEFNDAIKEVDEDTMPVGFSLFEEGEDEDLIQTTFAKYIKFGDEGPLFETNGFVDDAVVKVDVAGEEFPGPEDGFTVFPCVRGSDESEKEAIADSLSGVSADDIVAMEISLVALDEEAQTEWEPEAAPVELEVGGLDLSGFSRPALYHKLANGRIERITNAVFSLGKVKATVPSFSTYFVADAPRSGGSGGGSSSGGSGSSSARRIQATVLDDSTPVATGALRLYNPNEGSHFYTTNTAEKDRLVTAGWTSEGTAFNVATSGSIPVYRVYNPGNGEHFYTGSASERSALISYGWRDESIAWYGASERTKPVYRLYNKNSGRHFFTASAAEKDMLVSLGWDYEGEAFCAL